MKTLQQIAENYKSKTLDGRDLHRLAQFIPEEKLNDFGVSMKEEHVGTHEHKAFTRKNILKQLEEDVALGFEKCINERGISASLMYEVVKMWNWILEEGLENYDEYGWYGRSMFEITANKYGFEIKN